MNAESESRVTDRIQELDGWRAVSVLLVIFDHTITYKQVNLHSYALARVVLLAGNLGVSVFFVISGFVICRLFILEEGRFGSVSLRGLLLSENISHTPAPFCLPGGGGSIDGRGLDTRQLGGASCCRNLSL
jgi:hypothetical protein